MCIRDRANTAWSITDPPNFSLIYTGTFIWEPALCSYQDDQTFTLLMFFEEFDNDHIITSSDGGVYVRNGYTFMLEGYDYSYYPAGGYKFILYP